MCVQFRQMKASRGKVISDKDLEILLDRSDMLGEETHKSAVFDISVHLLLTNSHLLCFALDSSKIEFL